MCSRVFLACVGYTRFRFEWRQRLAQGSPRFTLSRSRMRSRTGLASPVENQAGGIAKYPRLRVHRHEARMNPAKRRSVYEGGKVVPEDLATNAKSSVRAIRRSAAIEPSFRPPFERISDPQIPLTRRDSRVASLFAAVSTAMTSPCCGVHSTHPDPQLETSSEGSEGGGNSS